LQDLFSNGTILPPLFVFVHHRVALPVIATPSTSSQYSLFGVGLEARWRTCSRAEYTSILTDTFVGPSVVVRSVQRILAAHDYLNATVSILLIRPRTEILIADAEPI
jgi:hypothetical protein